MVRLERRCLWIVVVSLALSVPGLARAQRAVSVVMLAPDASGAELGSLGRALERVLRASLEAQADLQLGETPPLRREDLQLAIGCVARSEECHGALARQLEAELLVMPEIDRVGGELVLTLVLFDVAGTRSRTVVRRLPNGGEAEVLDVVEPLVRDVLGLPPLEVSAPLPEPALHAGTSRGSDPLALTGGVAMLGAGAIALGIGIGFGVAAQGSLDGYRTANVEDDAAIDAALAQLERASQEATAAGVLVPLGVALAGAGGVWLLVELLGGGGGEVAIAPMLSPTSVGVLVHGSIGGVR